MQTFVSSVNIFWSVLTVIANIVSIFLIISIFSPKFRQATIIRFFADRALLAAFVVSLLASLGSLIYSDIIGYTPCKLCWFQRIFMYPQAVIFGIAFFRRDLGVKTYGVILSATGAAIALFHYVGQIGWNPLGLRCLAIGYSSSCTQNFVLEFGYITIPMMAFSAFILILLTLLIARK